MKIVANCGSFTLNGWRWKPLGKMLVVGEDNYGVNPVTRHKVIYAARIIIGLDVAGVPTHDIQDVMDAFAVLRQRQIYNMQLENKVTAYMGRDPSVAPSFVAQKGMWIDPRNKDQAQEDSVQIVVFSDLKGETPEMFQANMESIAEQMRIDFDQSGVILEHQKNGLVEQQVFFEA